MPPALEGPGSVAGGCREDDPDFLDELWVAGVEGGAASDSRERLLLLPEMRWSEVDERLEGALLLVPLLLWRELRWREDDEDDETMDAVSEEDGLAEDEPEVRSEVRWWDVDDEREERRRESDMAGEGAMVVSAGRKRQIWEGEMDLQKQKVGATERPSDQCDFGKERGK